MAIHRTVLAGCGAMAKGWLRAVADHSDLRDRVEVVGLVDIDERRASALAEEFGLAGAVVGCSLAAMIDDLRPDVVFDVVVPAARADVVRTALQGGAHILSEKPMAASMDEAREMLALARSADRKHAVVQNRRFVSGVRRMRRLVAEGTLGTITAVHCDFFIGPHFGGFREEMDHVLLLDMAIHTFDAMRFVLGGMPQAVYCHETNPEGSWYATGASANAIFEFANGVTATYRGSWCAEGIQTSWESAWRIVGTKGTLVWDGHDGFDSRVVVGTEGFLRETQSVPMPEPEDIQATQGHASVIRDFIASIERDTEPETAATDNIASLAMVFGAIASAESGKRVSIEI